MFDVDALFWRSIYTRLNPERKSEQWEGLQMKNLTGQVSHFNNTARLNVFLSSILNNCVHRLPTERRRRGRLNERNGGWGGGVGNWDMKERRENKSPSEEDDASWLEKQREILSLPSLILAFLSSLFLSLPLSLLCAVQRFSGSEHTENMRIIYFSNYMQAL